MTNLPPIMNFAKRTRLSLARAFIALSAFFVLPMRGQDQPPPPPVTPAAASDPFFFHDGDMPIVFLGDSITEQKMYTTLIETYLLTRFPDRKFTFRNAGWGGDTSWLSMRGDFDLALKRDVLLLKPKAVTIDFGMNDARGGDATYSKYLDSLALLVEDLKKAGVRVALFSPSPEEKYLPGAPAGSPYNLMLKKYVDGVKIVSDNEKVPFVDQFTPFVADIEAGRKVGLLNKTATPGDTSVVRLTKEGVHPNWGGHLIMATAILQGLHAPAEVSSVSLDAADHSITATQGCQIELMNAPNVALQFKRTDEILPWPIPTDPNVDMALKIPGFDPATALNRYLLKVTGLADGSYNLFIDNHPAGTYAGSDLGKGVNLGFAKQGPIYDQQQLILQEVLAKNDAYFNRWRKVQLFVAPDWLAKDAGFEAARLAEIARLDKVISDAEQTIETLRKPTPHVFKLVLAK